MSIKLTTLKYKKWCRRVHSPYLWWGVFALSFACVKSHNGRVDTPQSHNFSELLHASFVIHNHPVKQQLMFSSWLLLVYVLFFSFLTCPDLWADSPPWLQTGVSPPCLLFLLLLHSYKSLDSYKWHGIYPGPGGSLAYQSGTHARHKKHRKRVDFWPCGVVDVFGK